MYMSGPSNFSITLKIHENIYIRDPQQTELGRSILQHGILLIDELGLERFNFKKLAERIHSTEASIYRYFENKHKLLIYLINWYWEWMKFRIDYFTNNIQKPEERLHLALLAIVDTSKKNTSIEFIDEDILHRILVTEGIKAYHSKEVDLDNQSGYFLSYKSLCEKLARLILDINPEFKYPRTLASNLLEMANNQLYFALHLPRLTDLQFTAEDNHDQLIDMLEYFAFSLILADKENGTDRILRMI